MKRFLSSLLTIGFIVGSFNTLHAESPEEKMFASRVSKDQLRRVVRELVRFGPRMGGTTQGDRAAAYVAQRFRNSGLDVEMVEDPEKLTFAHRRWSLSVVEPRSLRKLIRNEWLAGFSPSVRPTKARLLYLGTAEESELPDIEGAAILTDRAITSKWYHKLAEKGVVCILLVSPHLEGAYSDWAFITNLKTSEENPIPVFNLSTGNGIKLKRALEQNENVVVSFSTETSIAQGKPKTVVATLKGKEDNYFIVCAHGDSDSGGPGADDNASGVAGVIEIARVLNAMVRANVISPPSKSIKFIVWGSEYFSTEQYVKKHQKELDKILGVMNFDEIGTGATRNCLYFESNDVEHNEKLLRTLQAVGDEYAGRKGFWEESTTNPSQGGTDSYVFLPAYLKHLKLPDVKIPSTTIYTGAWNELKSMPQTEGWRSSSWKGHPDSVIVDYSAYYHSSLDIPSLTTEKEPFNMVWAAKAVGIALLRLAWQK